MKTKCQNLILTAKISSLKIGVIDMKSRSFHYAEIIFSNKDHANA